MTTVRPAGDQDTGALARLVPAGEPAGFLDGAFVAEQDGVVTGVARLTVSTELPGGVHEFGWHTDDPAAAASLLDTGLAEHGAVFALVPEADTARRRFAESIGFADVGGGDHHGAPHRVLVALRPAGVHHVELWVADLGAAEKTFGWLFTELGWHEYQRWDRGVSWRRGNAYVVVEDSPARTGDRHERTAPGINHLALHAGTRADVDGLTAAAPAHGWTLMFADRHPHAGGEDHYAAYLENDDGFEVELVATRW